jgi:hypothetical protein
MGASILLRPSGDGVGVSSYYREFLTTAHIQILVLCMCSATSGVGDVAHHSNHHRSDLACDMSCKRGGLGKRGHACVAMWCNGAQRGLETWVWVYETRIMSGDDV